MKKTTPALIAAFIITVILGAGMLLIGMDALNGSSATAAAALPTLSAAQSQQAMTAYHNRETQYQQQIADLTAQLATANQQFQQDKTILTQLQNNGLITVASDGTISITQTGATLAL